MLNIILHWYTGEGIFKYKIQHIPRVVVVASVGAVDGVGTGVDVVVAVCSAPIFLYFIYYYYFLTGVGAIPDLTTSNTLSINSVPLRNN